MDHNLKKYATDIQWDEYCLYCEHKSYTQVAKILNKDRANIRRSINSLISKAAKQGYSPDHDMTHAVPDGYIAKGISTYYNADGMVTGQWVKSASDKERNIQILIDRLEQGSLNYKPFKPTPYKETADENSFCNWPILIL